VARTRAGTLVTIAVAAALVVVNPGGVAAADDPPAGGPALTLAPVADRTIDIYPGLVPIQPTVIPLATEPGGAAYTVRTTSTDKARVVLDGDELVVTPRAAGTLAVEVVAEKDGYAPARDDFVVHVVSRTQSGEYDWSGSAKIGGSGYVTGTVFSQIEPNVLYAMTDIGGAYRYDFARDYWVGLNDDATDHSAAYAPDDPRGPGRGATFVAGIVPDPVKKGRVYMAAGGSATNAAIYRSDDYGDHWKRFPIATTINGNDGSNRSTGPRLAVDPRDNRIVYFASQTAGLWKSVDAGEHFARISDAGDTAVDFRPTFVAIDPHGPVAQDGSSARVLVGTIGSTTTNAPAVSESNPLQQRPYHSIFVSQDGAATFAELPGQPDARVDRQYGGFVAEHVAFDPTGKLVVAYAEFSLANLTGVGSNSNFAQDGRVYRFDLDAGTSQDVTPQNVFTKEYPALTATDIANGQVMQRGGIGGISVDPRRPGVMVASSFHRHANFSEEVVWYTADYGAHWKVVHSEVVGKKDLRGYGYIDKDNGWGAAVHWAFDIQINPFDSDMALFNTGNGVWMTKNLTAADHPITADNEVVWGFWDDGLEETVIWNLYSPTQTSDYLYSTYADWGAMSWGEDYTVSPKNSLVNAESPANRVKYLDPPFDADGNPRYDLDADGNVQLYLKPGYFERWINTQNMDYAGNKQNVMVFTPSGNYQNTNISAGVISFDEGKTATPLAVPAGIAGAGPTAQNNAGWISVDASASTVVWSVGNQAVANTYWTDVSAGPSAAAVGSSTDRPQASAEVRVVAKNGDRAAWTKSEFYSSAGTAVTTGNVKLFSDKVLGNVFYGFTGTTMYVSTDGGRRFDQVVVGGAGVPNANWNTNGHGQGANKIQVDVYSPRSIWLASNNAAAGLVHVTYDAATSTWVSTKVSPGTTSSFQQVGMGLGLGDNSVPALYAAGVISDNTAYPAAAPHYGVYRSLDGGAHWARVNDDQHQFGDLRALSGDSRVFGRVYLGTGSRGIRVGEIDWNVDRGTDDRVTKSRLVVTAAKGAVAAGQPLDLRAELFDAWGRSQGDVTASTAFTTTVEAGDVSGTTNPFVSLTYVVRGAYTWSDDGGEHTVTSAPVRVQVYNVDALVPVVTGAAEVGSTLHAEVPAGWSVSFTWLRDGVAVGTGATHLVGPDDAGTALVVRASIDALDGVTRSSAPVAVPKIAPLVALTLSSASVSTVARASADVEVTAPGVATVPGSVRVSVGGHVTTVPLVGGRAHVTLPQLAAGTYAVEAGYPGSAHVAAGVSAARTLTVAKVVPTVSVKLAATSATSTTAPKATVTVAAAGVAGPTGVVTVAYGKASLKVALKAAQHGRVTVTLPKLAGGTYAVRATYGGDALVAARSSSAVTLKVAKVAPTVTAKLAATTVKHGRSVAVTVRVTASGAPAPTGKVTVSIGSSKKTVTLKAAQKGTVTVSFVAPKAGRYTVKASYGGDGYLRSANARSSYLRVK